MILANYGAINCRQNPYIFQKVRLILVAFFFDKLLYRREKIKENKGGKKRGRSFKRQEAQLGPDSLFNTK